MALFKKKMRVGLWPAWESPGWFMVCHPSATIMSHLIARSGFQWKSWRMDRGKPPTVMESVPSRHYPLKACGDLRRPTHGAERIVHCSLSSSIRCWMAWAHEIHRKSTLHCPVFSFRRTLNKTNWSFSSSQIHANQSHLTFCMHWASQLRTNFHQLPRWALQHPLPGLLQKVRSSRELDSTHQHPLQSRMHKYKMKDQWIDHVKPKSHQEPPARSGPSGHHPAESWLLLGVLHYVFFICFKQNAFSVEPKQFLQSSKVCSKRFESLGKLQRHPPCFQNVFKKW